MPVIAAVERVGLCPGRGPSGRCPPPLGEEVITVEVLFERVAGLDVGKASVTVCVRTPGPRGRRSEVRTFSTMTRSLQVMRDWLTESGVTIAAIESTSTDWKAPFYCLEEVLEV